MVRRSTHPRPPGPKGRWLVGNTLDYDDDRIGFLARCRTRYGDVFSFDRRTVVVTDPDLVHRVLGRTNSDFLLESLPLAERVDLDRMAGDAQIWMGARRQGWKGLTRSVAEQHADRLRGIFDDVVGTTAGEPVDVMTVMKHFFGRAAADFCLGTDAPGIPDLLAANTEAIEPLSTSSQAFPAWLPTGRVRRFVRAREETLEAITERVRRRAAAGRAEEQPRDLLDVLLAEREPALSELQIQRLLRGIMLAAYGVPAAALTWLVRELATRPPVRAAVAAEAAGRAPDGVPAPADLPYTEALVKEVLRLWPPTWIMGRSVRRPTELAGWPLHPGDQVNFSPYLLHRDPRWWSEPDQLCPERWLTPGFAPRRYAYLPFGAGPRVCVGAQLGTLQLLLATVWLVGRYEIVVDRAGEPDFRGLLLPRGFRASFRRRA